MAGDGEHIVDLADRRVDLVRQAVLFPDGSTKSLTTREAQLLGYLAHRAEQDVSRDELLEKVWEYRADYATRAVDVAMRRLRAKVEPDPQHPVHLIAVHGVGYRFVPPPDEPLPVRRFPVQPSDAPRSNLRPERSSFVGRVGELAAIGGLFSDGARIVSLLGPGGVGKTRLATRYAANQLDDWSGGAWLCELGEARGLSGVAAALGATLSVPLTGKEASLVAALGTALAGRGPILVVLDGFEHVLTDARDALNTWLELAPLAHFLVTSRERLRIEGEHAVEVGPLPIDEARALFLDRARASGARVEESDAGAVDRIADRLDRLPLAIELAAPRARVLSLDQLHQRLDQRFKVLAGTRGTEQENALRHAIDWSWELLSQAERRALAWCATFTGGFTLDAAEALIEDPEAGAWALDLVEALRDKSLVHAYEPAAQPGDVRFALYETIRDYAAEKLDAAGERAEAEARHAAYFLQYGEELATGIDRPGGLDDLRCLAAEVDNLLAVVRRRGAEAPSEEVRAVLAMSPLFLTRGPYPLHRKLLDHAVAAIEADDPQWLARLLVQRANLERMRAQMDEANADVGRALQLVGGTGTEVEGEALALLALVNADTSRLDEAEVIARQALPLARESGLRDLEGMVLAMLGSYAAMRGRSEEAERQYLEAIRIHEEVGNARRTALDNANLGMLLVDQGRVEEAEQRTLAALAIHRAWDNGRRTAHTLMSLALIRSRQHRYGEAAEHVEEALRLFREVGYTRFVAHAVQNLASLKWAQEGPAAAVPLYMDAIARFQEVGDRLSEGMAQALFGASLAATGDVPGARAGLDQADKLLQGLYNTQASGIAMVARGFLDLATDDRGAAEQKAADGMRSPLLGLRFIAELLSVELEQ